MNKRDYFLTALHAGACKKRAWVNSVFTVTRDTGVPDTTLPYRLVTLEDQTCYYFEDPEQNGELTEIEGSDKNEPLFRFKEPCVLHPGDIANYSGDGPLTTTYGNVFVNYLILVLPFGKALSYRTGHVKIKDIEAEILKQLVDDPANDDGSPPPEGQIYVRQMLMFADYALSLVAYSALAVTPNSFKAMQGHPDAIKVRNELVEKYKDQLTDPAIVAMIGKELENLDREWLKDDPTYGFYNTNDSKSFGNVRKKMFYMFGAESPFQDGTTVEFIEPSLNEGIDINHLPAMINSLRAGTHARGAQTQLGGESVKTIYRMLGTSRIAEDDCGSRRGVPLYVGEKNKREFVGHWKVEPGADVLLTDENIDTYVGQVIDLRSPMTCQTEGKNVCKICIGVKMAETPDGLAAAAAQVGGAFLTTFLKKMHGSTLSTETWDPSVRLS